MEVSFSYYLNIIVIMFFIIWSVYYYQSCWWKRRAIKLAEKLNCDVTFGNNGCYFEWISYPIEENHETELLVYGIEINDFKNMEQLEIELRAVLKQWLQELNDE